MSAGLIKIYSITSGDFITPRLGPTYGPIVGGVVGSVVGFFFGQPGLGYAIGSTLGGLLNPVSPENQEVFGRAFPTSRRRSAPTGQSFQGFTGL